MKVAPSQFDLISKAMETADLRHKVIAHNVANVNTPFYRRLSVDFEDALKERIESHSQEPLPVWKREADISDLSPKIVEHPSRYFRADSNNVDINAEMGRLNKNSLLHNSYVAILGSKLAAMRRAIERG